MNKEDLILNKLFDARELVLSLMFHPLREKEKEEILAEINKILESTINTLDKVDNASTDKKVVKISSKKFAEIVHMGLMDSDFPYSDIVYDYLSNTMRGSIMLSLSDDVEIYELGTPFTERQDDE